MNVQDNEHESAPNVTSSEVNASDVAMGKESVKSSEGDASEIDSLVDYNILDAAEAAAEAEHEREQLIVSLQDALSEVKRLSGLLPICANCKKIRNDQGYWQDVAVYIRDHSEAEFTHGVCPDCVDELYPELAERRKGKKTE